MADVSSIKLPNGTTYTVKDSTARYHIGNGSNPHGVTKAQVGLGNVANYDQSKAIKSISRVGRIFTATALDGTTFTFTQQDLSDLINNLSIGIDIPKDNDYFISQYAGGGTSHVSYHRRQISTIWSYIKAKADSVYQPKGSYASTAAATTNANGLMSAADKIKLDNLSATSVSAITNSEIDSIVAS